MLGKIGFANLQLTLEKQKESDQTFIATLSRKFLNKFWAILVFSISEIKFTFVKCIDY